MKIHIVISATFLLLFTAVSVNGQSNTSVVEDVILFNSQPYMVRMTNNGKILAFISEASNNYTALNNIKPKTVMVNEADIENAIDLARAGGNLLDTKALATSMEESKNNEEKEVMPIEEETIEEMQEAIAEVAKTEEEDILSKGEAEDEDSEASTKTNYDYEFAFDHRDATLSPSSVNQLLDVARILNENANSQVEIKSYYSETVDISKILSKNRAKGIHDMLVSNGIESSRITISESNNEDWANNRVKVSIH